MKVAVNGAKGKMGTTTVGFINDCPELTLAGEIDLNDSLEEMIKSHSPDVVVEFTRPEARMKNVETILKNGASAVVGTTGFTPENLKQIQTWVKETGNGCVIAPNFCISAILLQQFAVKASAYFDTAEIIEYHHDQKVDSPSGTAVKTAELMSESGKIFNQNTNDKVENLKGARGAELNGIKLHAVRLPGYVASQEVILSDHSQYMTIRQDSVDRTSFMPGVLAACKYINNKAELIYGLEHIL